ncbi:hypothetical protein K2173_003878 [Erythroxylum novogranatense]|uniref:Uncharacterized protein n=1 Tax=Erythroxylum novogranatense TaxID=1862640 RepID=A0AAV8SIZ6_9ROSI|nr:hypothetical protein K2173_003878 [Erythroxylum novogranatense]
MPFMGGNSNSNNSRQKKSFSSGSLSLFSFMKPSRRPRRGYEAGGNCDDAMNESKVWPSDEDKVRWVADPRINTKASAFIDRFHATRLSEPERQVPKAAGKA